MARHFRQACDEHVQLGSQALSSASFRLHFATFRHADGGSFRCGSGFNDCDALKAKEKFNCLPHCKKWYKKCNIVTITCFKCLLMECIISL